MRNKKSNKSLNLHKKSISRLNQEVINGGRIGSIGETAICITHDDMCPTRDDKCKPKES